MNHDPIVITGFGTISALGNDVSSTLASLKKGTSGIGLVKYLKTDHHEFPVGEVKLSNEEMEQHLGIDSNVPTTRTALMGMIALDEAIIMAGLDHMSYNDDNIAFISGTTVGGMDKSEQHYLDFLEGNSFKEYISTHDCGACSRMIASRYDFFNFIATPSTACSSAANSIILGANMLLTGKSDIVVAGGSECITKFHLNGFNTLMILDREECRPFDDTRAGLNLGEGAAYLVLERMSHAMKRGACPLAILAGWGNACDAFHQTASSDDGEGAYLAMKQALELAGVKPSQINYINAHGTGTPNNDISETHAMQRLFGNNIPPVSSTKSSTGHTTSASGAIESVITLLGMLNDFLPANRQFKTPIPGGITPVTHPTTGVSIEYALCNSFGFGGNDSSLLFKKTVGYCGKGSALKTNKKTVYILAANHISLQEPLSNQWLEAPIRHEGKYNEAIDPQFKQWLSAGEARRLGKIMKRAVATSAETMRASGITHPDAIITATGLGCVKNTELFLTDLCNNGEQLLKPTQFMQSTHNTIGSLIAIINKCHGYNVTYANGDISTETAIFDAMTQLSSGSIKNALIGAHDEMTPSYYTMLERIGYYGADGMVTSGETAVSFMLSTEDKSDALCVMDDVRILHNPNDDAIDNMLSTMGQTDCIIAGYNGNKDIDNQYSRIISKYFTGKTILQYKNLFGESMTSSAFGIYAAANILANGVYNEDMIVKISHHHSLNSIICLNISDNSIAAVKLSSLNEE